SAVACTAPWPSRTRPGRRSGSSRETAPCTGLPWAWAWPPHGVRHVAGQDRAGEWLPRRPAPRPAEGRALSHGRIGLPIVTCSLVDLSIECEHVYTFLIKQTRAKRKVGGTDFWKVTVGGARTSVRASP